MSHKNDKWVRRFLVTDPTLHAKQFTIYKVTSVVFPRGMPEAATKVIIWKRYSDFKKLHEEIKVLCKSLKIQNFPRLEKATYFKRFDPSVIESRRKAVLTMLEFIADNSLLFTSDLFTKFLQGNSYLPGNDSGSNDVSSVDSSLPKSSDLDKYPNDSASHCSTDSRCSSAVDNDSAIYSSVLSVDVPFIDSPSDSVSHFKFDAKESPYHPKLSADSLLSNQSVGSVPSPMIFESSRDQKFKFAPSTCSIHEKFEDGLNQFDSDVACRISYRQQDLSRFQIIGILKHLMYVQDRISKQFYLIKGVPKSVDSNNWNKANILPHCTTNMVRLHHAVETDSSLYLILEYVKHVKLWDHLTNYFNQRSQKKETPTGPPERQNSLATKSKFNCLLGSPLHSNKFKDSSEFSQKDSYSELIRSYRAESQKISTSLLSIPSKVLNKEQTFNDVLEKKVKHLEYETPLLETGSQEEDNFNKLMKKIDLFMESKERETFSKSTPDITSNLTSSGAKSESEAAVTDGKWLTSSEVSNSFSNKFDSSLISIDSISESLDDASSKYVDQGDSSSKTEVMENNLDFSFSEKISLKETSSRISKCDSHSVSNGYDENDHASAINPDSDIELIKDSCYKVLNKIEAVLNKKTDEHHEDAERSLDPSHPNHAEEITLTETNTDDLIEKAQQLLDSVNETLQQCDKQVNNENSHSTKVTKYTKSIKHHPSFESIFERNAIVDSRSIAASAAIKPVLRSTLSEKGLFEKKRENEHNISSVNTGRKLAQDRSGLIFKENNDLTVDLTTIRRETRRKSDDWKTAFSNIEHAALSPQIVMNEDSTFNFNMLFADPVSVTEDKIRLWAAEILIALENLHQRGIVCWDLHPDNILLSHDGKIKLTYFYRHSKVLPIWSSVVLEGYHVAPELLVVPPAPPDESQDWWSYGVLLFHLLSGKSLSSHHPEGFHPHTVVNIPDTVSSSGSSLLSQLLKYDPRERLGSGPRRAEEIKSHSFFNNFKWG
nr:PREDICTED: ribosomal protein S6 kinase delta-1 [Bemisia tabaci]XP_018898782.1 PREDICTED: ribosomal protein S6 kinase delta-1 [Bemisia tabaci]